MLPIPEPEFKCKKCCDLGVVYINDPRLTEPEEKNCPNGCPKPPEK